MPTFHIFKAFQLNLVYNHLQVSDTTHLYINNLRYGFSFHSKNSKCSIIAQTLSSINNKPTEQTIKHDFATSSLVILSTIFFQENIWKISLNTVDSAIPQLWGWGRVILPRMPDYKKLAWFQRGHTKILKVSCHKAGFTPKLSTKSWQQMVEDKKCSTKSCSSSN